MNGTTIPLLRAPAPVRTTCPYCGVGCGLLATPRAGASPQLAGDPEHPANAGRLCVKGAALGETLGLQGRLLRPRMRQRQHQDPHPQGAQSGPWLDLSWPKALEAVARGFGSAIERHGPDAVALYLSGQLLTEDYYVANKLMKGFIGSANIDTNSRLCMSSAVAGHKRAFGEDLVPVGYADLEQADLVVLVGSNLAWCHPVLFQRLVRARQARPAMKLVVIDPRRTATCEFADLHLPIRSGTDVWLFNGLLAFLAQQGEIEPDFVARHTRGLEQALAAARADACDLATVARTCSISQEALTTFYRWFAGHARCVSVFSQGVNQSSAGTDKVNSIINCHLFTGRIGRPGMGPFSITGQPNAMGGREVGGLANTLAAHLELANPAHRALVQQFWQSPRMADRPGLQAVQLFQAMEAGRIKAIWIMGTNPVVSLPDADQARRALAACELVVVSDVMAATDTLAYADIALPALAWGEKSGMVTNSERCISRQRAFLPAPGEARADWDMLAGVARRMGFAGFDYTHASQIFDEHARLSAYRNHPGPEDGQQRRCFNIGGLAGMDAAAYDAFQPRHWPVPPSGMASAPGSGQLFGDGVFAHEDGRARFVATPARAPAHAADARYPFILNTGRVRDQWHTMTRTGQAPTLAEHSPEPFAALHPHDGLQSGLREGALARLHTHWGAMVARVRLDAGMARGTVFVPIHWNAQFASDARVGALVNPVTDPLSGEPEFKHTPVRIEPFEAAWHGFVLMRQACRPPAEADWWVRIQGRDFERCELAGLRPLAEPRAWARQLLGAPAQADWIEYQDAGAGIYRAGHVEQGRLQACVFLSPRTDLPPRRWLGSLFAQERLGDPERASLMLGQPLQARADAGPIVCACFGVGRNTICAAIAGQGLKTTAEVTACLKAGGNCGSCLPELKHLLMA
ncbi:nitrate reductase [Comamonas composti]|uniref:nitrate reductase n=1 Tax=Comamonas composti TaxID=408558 RepID=UPI00041D6B9C|nr:nitrate reductase [Comamonas composti]